MNPQSKPIIQNNALSDEELSQVSGGVNSIYGDPKPHDVEPILCANKGMAQSECLDRMRMVFGRN